MFSDTYYPEKNGQAIAIKMYKELMEDLGHSVYLFVPKYNISQKRNESNVFEFPSVSYIFDKNLRFAIPVSPNLKIIKNLNLDIIHTHDPLNIGLFASYVARRLRIKHVGTYHTMLDYYRHYLPKIIRPSKKSVEKLLRKWCVQLDKVIAPTETIKNVLISYGVPEYHIKTIPTGIDMNIFNENEKINIREKHNLNMQDKILLYVGRINKEKNIDFLIKIFHKIQKNDKNIKFIIIGLGKERTNLELLANRLKISNKVIFTGGLAREEVIDYYKQSDLFIFASYTETQGLVVLESMAAGTPVVALGKMGVYDILNNPESGGLMIEELNEEIFCNSIKNLLYNKTLYNSYSIKGIDYVKKYFSTNKNVEKLIELYNSVIKE